MWRLDPTFARKPGFMHINAYVRGAASVVLGASAGLAFATSAWATDGTTIPINQGNVPTTAGDFSIHECTAELGGGPYAGKDVWVFNLPSVGGESGSFTSITAYFDTDGNGTVDKTVVIEAGSADDTDGIVDDIVTAGHSKAYAITPAGWTLIDATAVVTGDNTKFVLTHTCPGSSSPTTTPTSAPTSAPTTMPTTTPTSAPTTMPTTAPTTGATSPSSPAPSSSTGGVGNEGENGGGLPVTGAAASTAAAVGLGLIGGGAALMIRRRRRFTA